MFISHTTNDNHNARIIIGFGGQTNHLLGKRKRLTGVDVFIGIELTFSIILKLILFNDTVIY